MQATRVTGSVQYWVPTRVGRRIPEILFHVASTKEELVLNFRLHQAWNQEQAGVGGR